MIVPRHWTSDSGRQGSEIYLALLIYYLVLPLNLSPIAKYGLVVVMALPIVISIYEFVKNPVVSSI